MRWGNIYFLRMMLPLRSVKGEEVMVFHCNWIRVRKVFTGPRQMRVVIMMSNRKDSISIIATISTNGKFGNSNSKEVPMRLSKLNQVAGSTIRTITWAVAAREISARSQTGWASRNSQGTVPNGSGATGTLLVRMSRESRRSSRRARPPMGQTLRKAASSENKSSIS